jgi:hypothetical protein
MADDPMPFLQHARPTLGPDIRPIAAGEINGRPLDELSTSPTSPLYRSKIPLPPCHQCGEDHIPGKSYGHNWMPEPEPLKEPELHYVHAIEPSQIVPATPLRKRVAVYVGRSDTYIVAVETPPDWDTEQSFKTTGEEALLMVRMARALGTKIADKTGGDLAALAQDASEPA